MPKSFTLDGKRHRLDPKIPTGQIEWLVRREHVATGDSEIAAMIRERATGWSDRLINQAVAYAIKCHRDNQDLYRHVYRG